MNNTLENIPTTEISVVQPKEITLETVLDAYEKGHRVAVMIAKDITGIFDYVKPNPFHREGLYCERSNQEDIDKINVIIRDNKLGLICLPPTEEA